jgi:hypothetical protein
MAASTVSLPASAAHLVPKPYEASFMATTMTATLATTSLDDVGDTVEMGYLPGNCAVLGFLIQTASLAASALIYKIQVNGVDIVTTIGTGNGGAAASAIFWITTGPLVIPGGAPQKVQIVVTTVATTPAAGVFNLTPLYINS